MAIPVRVICNLAVNKNLRRVGIEKMARLRKFVSIERLVIWMVNIGLTPNIHRKNISNSTILGYCFRKAKMEEL
jgi:hypothetical protein